MPPCQAILLPSPWPFYFSTCSSTPSFITYKKERDYKDQILRGKNERKESCPLYPVSTFMRCLHLASISQSSSNPSYIPSSFNPKPTKSSKETSYIHTCVSPSKLVYISNLHQSLKDNNIVSSYPFRNNSLRSRTI